MPPIDVTKTDVGLSKLNLGIFFGMLRFEQLSSVCVGQAVDEINRLGPVVTEDQSASLPASVSVRYGRLTEVSKCVQVHVQVTNIEPCRVVS